MRDNDALLIIVGQIEKAIADEGLPMLIIQKPSTDQQGAGNSPAIYFERLFDDVIGSPQSTTELVRPAMEFDDTSTQAQVMYVQVSARYRQDPNDLSIPTPMDALSIIRLHLQNRHFVHGAAKLGIGIQRVTSTRNEKFENDLGQFESFPSFDLAFCYNRSIKVTIPGAIKAEEALLTGV